MGTAKGVLALLEAEIRFPAVVYGSVLKIFEQRGFTFQRLPAPFLVNEQVGKPCGGGDVESMEAFLHTHARFIKMSRLGGQYRLFDLFFDTFEALVYAGVGRYHSAFIE